MKKEMRHTATTVSLIGDTEIYCISCNITLSVHSTHPRTHTQTERSCHSAHYAGTHTVVGLVFSVPLQKSLRFPLAVRQQEHSVV